MEVLRIQNLKYDKNFQLIIVFLINTLLFVRMEQKSRQKTAIQMCSLEKVFIEKNNKVGKILEKQL